MTVNELGRKRDSDVTHLPDSVDQSDPALLLCGAAMPVTMGSSHISILTTTNAGGRSSIATQPNRRTRNEHYYRYGWDADLLQGLG